MSRVRKRNWVFTFHKPDDVDELAFFPHALVSNATEFQYIGGQLERAETGRLHIQGLAVCKNAIGLASFKNKFGHQSVHAEPMRGTFAEARAYCSKEESRVQAFQEFGDPPAGRGTRSDLSLLALNARNIEVSAAQAFEESPGLFLRYGSHFDRLRARFLPQRDFQTELEIIWGPTGSGKSTYASETYTSDSTFWWSSYMRAHNWWDGYDPVVHRNIVLDEFSSDIKLRLLYELISRTPLMVPVKGASVPFRGRKVILVTNYQPEELYGTVLATAPASIAAAFRRRLFQATTIFRGYGDNLDLRYCDCAQPDVCFREHDPIVVHRDERGIRAAVARRLVVDLDE